MTSQWNPRATVNEKCRNGINFKKIMLKQVRHISEGNFYGLRVTNKARKLSLDKELRTLEACKDVQSHVYRKEEKELISTLKRLQQTKHDHFDHHEDHDHSARLSSHHDRRASFHSEQHSNDEHRHLRRPTERNHGKVQVKVRSEITDQKSTAKVPCKVKVLADTSDVSVIISLSPIASSVPAANETAAASLPPVVQPPTKETGTEIHRTQGFTSCVICNLPRCAHGKENSNLCRCHADPSKHPHRGHEQQEGTNKRRKSHTDDDELKTFAAKRERRRSLEIEDLLAPHSTKKNHFIPATHHRHHGRSRASSFEEDNKTHVSEIGPVKARAFGEYTAYVPGVGVHKRNIPEHQTALKDHHVHEQGTRSREASLSENRSRKNSLEEDRSRWNSYTDGRNRDNSLGEHEEPHYMRPLKGHYGSRHNRTSQEEELHSLYSRLQRAFPISGEHPHATHLPLYKSRRDAAANAKDEDPAPAFSGLMHPDNIINHHHFLPYEADKQNKPRTTAHQAPHPPPHPAAFHIMGIDRHGNRQDVSGIYLFRPEFESDQNITHIRLDTIVAVYRMYHMKGIQLRNQGINSVL